MNYVYRYSNCVSYINSEIGKLERLMNSVEKNFSQMDLVNVDAMDAMGEVKDAIISDIKAEISSYQSKKGKIQSW